MAANFGGHYFYMERYTCLYYLLTHRKHFERLSFSVHLDRSVLKSLKLARAVA